MKKGIVIFLIGYAGAGGALDLNKSLVAPTVMMIIGLILICRSMWKESNEKSVSSYRDRIVDRDINRPYFLRR